MKFFRVLMVCLFLVAGLTAGAQAEIRTIPMGTEQSRLTLVSHDDNSMVYDVEVGNLTAMDVDTKEGTFTRLVIPDFYASTHEGWPQLPMMNRLVEIPYGADARVEVVSSSSRTIDLADHGITHQIFPAQPSMPKDADPASWPFVIDRSVYAGGRVAQELAGIVDLGTLRSVHMGRVEISPVEYLPAQNRIVVHDQVRLRIVFAGADPAVEQDFKARTYSPFFEGLYGKIEGYRGLHTQYPDRVRDVVTLVVVTPPQYAAQMQTFVNWKIRRGFHTIVAVTGTPEVGTTKESIQAYLFGLYNNATPQQPAPSFVVFVGDTDVMPTWLEAGDCTDRRYCAVDADLMPDMYYGRMSCANPTQLQNILDKTLMYDQFTMPDPSYLGRVTMIGGMDGSYGQVWANGQINYGTSLYFNAAHGITSQTHLYPNSGSQAAQIVAEVSQGVAYINYTAHGSQTSWSDPSFTQANINGLQNSGKYCLAVGNACLTSDFDYSSECFAETFLRAANKGAIGYIGGSNSTYWDEDYYWGVGYRTSIVEHPVFDAAHMGGYDGLFHDHGEAMTQWYVTNDALIFCGNLAVTESGSSRITYYWNIYNLMGDPSISTFLGVPTANPVTHPTTVFTTWSSIPITAVPNSYVGLTKNGVLIGAGTTDAAGQLTLPIWASPLTPGAAHLVVMAQNRIPYQTDLNVIVPAVVTMNPNVIDANVTTAVDIGVYEYDGITPKPGVEVWASGLQYESTHATTGTDGHCSLSITYPYGPSVDIVGKNPAESWNLFRLPLAVRASILNHPELWVTTGVGLADTLALNLPGTLHAYIYEGGHTLYALLNGTQIASTGATTLDLTPDATGTMRGIIGVSGYNIYYEDFPVIEAYGTLSGHVDANGQPGAGAVVKGYDGDGALAFQTTANTLGNYTMPDPILCATYTIKVDYFGYLHWEQPFFVNYGANTLPINLAPAPAGVITGTVTEEGTGLPLDATVKVYRSDTMALYTQAVTDPVTGVFTTASLPYFNWVLVVRAWHHTPQSITVTVDQPSVTRDFVLATTVGDILLIDNAVKGGLVPAKVDEKTGAVIEPGYDLGTKDAAADIMADLENLGFNVTVEDLTSNPANWTTYDLLIISCGANVATLDETIKPALISFVNSGGHLLLEGGEVGYDHYGDAAFASTVMHITGWAADASGSPTVAVPTHYVMSVPNTITGPITLAYVGYGDSDALTAATGAVVAGSWTTQAGKASVLCYDPNPAPEGGSFVFFSFNYSVLDATKRADLLHNAVVWLTTPESGNCSVAGAVTLAGQSDHSGVKVEAISNGGFTYTNVPGAYSLPGLFAGTYTIRASKQGWTTAQQQVTLTSGQQLTGLNFTLSQIYQDEVCRTPNLAIPDNNPTGVTDNMTVAMSTTVSSLEVYVRITHTYQGDLIVKLRSPAGTEVILHNRTGGSTDNIVGWYPSPLIPAQSLDAFIGQSTDGVWKLIVSDNAGIDTGTLNEWCLRITHANTTDVPGVKVVALALSQSLPNPARGTAAIRFDLPRSAAIDLAVFDVAGRRVMTLFSGIGEAGSHEAIWRGLDEAGRVMPSGIYFYRLQAEGRTLTRKLMLLQ
jgi:subtilisin-like proprotein convertase family protein